MTTFTFNDVGLASSWAALTTRPLAERAIGNQPLRQHQCEVLNTANSQSSSSSAGHAYVVTSSAWLEPDDVFAFMAQPEAGRLLAADGSVMIARAGATGEDVVAGRSFLINHPWDLILANERFLAKKQNYTRAADFHSSLYVDGRLQVGKGTKILPGVVIEGDVVIGEDCKIGPNCYIRGATSIGNRCHVGQSVELKNSILMDGTNVGHLSYVGDSVLGQKVNLGAGTVTSNLRHDGKNHRSLVGDALVDTGRRKFGAILGDGVHTGINTSLYPGRKIGPGATTRPGAIVERDIHS